MPLFSCSDATGKGTLSSREPHLYLESGLAADSTRRGQCYNIATKLAAASHKEKASLAPLSIEYPFDGTVFPPDIVAPEFRWRDANAGVGAWLLEFSFDGGESPIHVLSETRRWKPSPRIWGTIQGRSLEEPARLRIRGLDDSSQKPVSVHAISLSTSRDPVGAPIFYREVPLPFPVAFRNVNRIQWRLGDVASEEPPPVVLEEMPACGNCHSFSADGRTLGMDVDHARDKGRYIVTPVAKETVFSRNRVISWSEFQPQDLRPSLGLLARVSPDGRHVVATVKERSVFVPTYDVAFSLLYFPIEGCLAIYSRETERFQALPGADDRDFVHTSPGWSPDGKWIVFARARAARLESPARAKDAVLTQRECRDFLKKNATFRYDLYQVPFNGGRGGRALPLEGASANGKSNYFPRYSPDGRWIVFCQSESFLFLQPDSELYIVPAGGGEARRLRCNLPRMNSWHSWSPNGKWLVFSSKANGPYTQLFLTHIDRAGKSTPAVVLAQFTREKRAANLPEFVNIRPGDLQRIEVRLGPESVGR